MYDKKIYIHHEYKETLFFKLFHNTTNITYIEKGKTTKISCKYNQLKFILIFDKEIHDNKDGYHLIDWFETLHEIQSTNPEKNDDNDAFDLDCIVLSELQKVLINKKSGWIVTILRGEKIFVEANQYNVRPGCIYEEKYQRLLQNICLNHFVATDNFLLKNSLKQSNFYHVLTNTLFQWNEVCNIKWFQEYKHIHERLNFDFDIGFSIRNPRYRRICIMEEMLNLNNPRFFLQVTDYFHDLDKSDLKTRKNINKIQKLINDKNNLQFNSTIGKNHFDNLKIASGGCPFRLGLDIFFRHLSKAKIQILDESYLYPKQDITTQFLSEKTLGYILAGIPFIPTSLYTIQYINHEIGLRYPFYEDIKRIGADSIEFVNFLKEFMNNFEQNYQELRNWSDLLYSAYMHKIYHENSLLDLINYNFEELPSFKKNKKLI